MASSPAEQLAKAKQRKRQRKPGHRCNGKPSRRPRVWICAIREIRESLGLSIRDVAEATGYTISGLWDIEHGTDPLLTTVGDLTEFYGKAVWELWPERGSDVRAIH